jgi:hypothetical protein
MLSSDAEAGELPIEGSKTLLLWDDQQERPLVGGKSLLHRMDARRAPASESLPRTRGADVLSRRGAPHCPAGEAPELRGNRKPRRCSSECRSDRVPTALLARERGLLVPRRGHAIATGSCLVRLGCTPGARSALFGRFSRLALNVLRTRREASVLVAREARSRRE